MAFLTIFQKVTNGLTNGRTCGFIYIDYCTTSTTTTGVFKLMIPWADLC